MHWLICIKPTIEISHSMTEMYLSILRFMIMKTRMRGNSKKAKDMVIGKKLPLMSIGSYMITMENDT